MGPGLHGVSGHVERPGVYEFAPPTSRLEAIEAAGGVWKGRALKAVIPGGFASGILRADECGDAEIFDRGPGSAGTIVLDATTCIVDVLWNVLRFFHHESCGHCPPCREGTGWMAKIVGRIESGGGREGDLDLLEDLAGRMPATSLCSFAGAAAVPARSYLSSFRSEFEEHIAAGGCPMNPKAEVARR
jgi:NADH-quinone oxidoreductase subunit F